MKTWQEYYWSCTCDVEILALWIIYTPEVQLNRYQKPCRHILNEGTLKPKPSFWLVNFSECRDPVIWGVEILIQGIYESKRCFKRNAPLEHSNCWDCSLPHSFKYLEKLKQNKTSPFFLLNVSGLHCSHDISYATFGIERLFSCFLTRCGASTI